MSDGEDTSGKVADLQNATTELKMLTSDPRLNTCFHAIGFGSKVDEKFLQTVVNMGSEPGMFRYADSVDDLGGKFFDIFDISSSTMAAEIKIGSVTMPVTLDNVHDQVYSLEVLLPSSIIGSPPHKEGKESKEESKEEIKEMKSDKSAPVTSLVLTVDGQEYKFALEPMTKISNITRLKALELVEPKNEEDVVTVLREISLVPQKASTVMERMKLTEMRKEINARFTEYLTLLNSDKIKSSVTALRLNSLKFDHKFAKARRNRSAAMRTQTNLTHFETMDSKLKKLYFDTCKDEKSMAEIDALTKKKDWQCALSLTSLRDLWPGIDAYNLNEAPADDFLCWAVTVHRDEVVLDCPSMGLKILNYSSTVITYNTFMEYMDRAIAERGAKGAHGGFIDSKKQQMEQMHLSNDAFCTVGSGGEKFNAVIPLYIHPRHYDRVKTLKRNWLGYLYTLDGFLYEKNQEVAFLHLLGDLICRYDGTEFQAKMIEQLSLIANDFVQNSPQFADAISAEKMDKFISTPQGRQRQFFPSLSVPLVMSYLSDRAKISVVSTSVTATTKEGKEEVKESKEEVKESKGKRVLGHYLGCSMETMWKPIYYEYLKRNVRDLFSNNEVEAHKIAQKLLYGCPDHPEGKSAHKASDSRTPENVLLQQVEESFAEWFQDPTSTSVMPSLSTLETLSKGKDSAPKSESDMRNIVPSCDDFVQSLLVDVPEFLARGMTNSQRLLSKSDASSSSSSSSGKKFDKLGKLSKLSIEEMHEARCNLLLSYYFFNCYPPDEVTTKNIMEIAHTKFQRDLDNRYKNRVRSEDSQHTANIIASTDSLLAFAGMLKICCPNRNGDVFERVVDNLIRSSDKQKLACILSNRVPIIDDDRDYGTDDSRDYASTDDYLSLYSGTIGDFVCIPTSRTVLEKILTILGKEKVKSIEKYHRDNKSVTGHKYRGGHALKNRHDYSDDRPYPGHRYSFVSYSGHSFE